MKNALSGLAWLMVLAPALFAGEGEPAPSPGLALVPVGVTVLESALGQADTAVAKSVVNSTILKGEVGEAIRDRYLHQTGKWINVSPRMGRQGLDHVSVRLGADNVPRRLLVDETKFRSSQLAQPAKGDIQFGEKWISKRLSGLASRLRKIGQATEIGKLPSHLPSRQSVQIPLSDTEQVTFWREDGRWKCDASPESLPQAMKQKERLANLFQTAAEGRIDYRKRVFQVDVRENTLKITIRDGKLVDQMGGAIGKLPVVARIDMPLSRQHWASDEIRQQLAVELRRQRPYVTSDDADSMAGGIVQSARTYEETLVTAPYGRFTATQALKAGTLAVLIVGPAEALLELVQEGHINWDRTAGLAVLSGGSAAVGSVTRNATTALLIRSELGYSASGQVAKVLGLGSAARFANVAGTTVGGGVAGVIFVYGGYALGYYDLRTANRGAIAGVLASGGATLATYTTLSLVGAYGTAGTGVAISSLSGAAASSSSLAWLGGGSIASGGLGMAGGTVVLTGGAGVVVIVVSVAVLYGFELLDEREDIKRIGLTIEHLMKTRSWEETLRLDGLSR